MKAAPVMKGTMEAGFPASTVVPIGVILLVLLSSIGFVASIVTRTDLNAGVWERGSADLGTRMLHSG